MTRDGKGYDWLLFNWDPPFTLSLPFPSTYFTTISAGGISGNHFGLKEGSSLMIFSPHTNGTRLGKCKGKIMFLFIGTSIVIPQTGIHRLTQTKVSNDRVLEWDQSRQLIDSWDQRKHPPVYKIGIKLLA